MIQKLRNAAKWLWAVGAAIVAVAWLILEARARGRQAKHDQRLEDLQDEDSARRHEKVTTEVEAARRAAATAKKRKEHAEKALDQIANASDSAADVLSRYNAHRVRKPADAP